jgi:hypothetical protein
VAVAAVAVQADCGPRRRLLNMYEVRPYDLPVAASSNCFIPALNPSGVICFL